MAKVETLSVLIGGNRAVYASRSGEGAGLACTDDYLSGGAVPLSVGMS